MYSTAVRECDEKGGTTPAYQREATTGSGRGRPPVSGHASPSPVSLESLPMGLIAERRFPVK
jgi:hypothetical protein